MPLIFLHVPKAAGTTFRAILERQYGRDSMLNLPVYGRSLDEHLSDIDPAARARYRAVVGHAPFGIGRHFEGETQYVTILRDPVERTVSRYYHILRRGPRWPIYTTITEANMSLLDFALGDPDIQVDNGQTRQLAGLDYRADNVPPGSLTREHLDAALANLDRCTVVGVTTEFDRSLVLMRRKLQWRIPLYVEVNKGSADRTRARSSLTDAEKDAIRQRNSFDDELYRHAMCRLEADCRAEGRGFELELRAFRALNTIAGRVHHLVRKPRA
jgi:hypothetical protein